VSALRRNGPPLWWPLAILGGLSLGFHFSQWDWRLEHWFWSPTAGWRFADQPFVQFLYHYGPWPALLVGVTAAVIWCGSMLSGRGRTLRPLSLFMTLVLIAGPGLLVNAGFKDHFGRPRPIQTRAFGGDQPFRPLGEPGPKGGGKSFPSGHASTGFYWLALAVYFWDRERAWAWAFGALGIGHGLLMGIGRMAQGKHWPSDVLWAAGMVYLTAWLLHQILFHRGRAPAPRPALTPVSIT